jgi:hypothetical protein
MSQRDEIPFESAKIRDGVARFFANQPDFDIRSTSVLDAFKHPHAFDGVSANDIPKVKDRLKTMQRVQAFAPTQDLLRTQ